MLTGVSERMLTRTGVSAEGSDFTITSSWAGVWVPGRGEVFGEIVGGVIGGVVRGVVGGR